MSTPTEQLIKQLKKSSKSGALLVPLIEEFCRNPVEIDDKHDREYIRRLIWKRWWDREQKKKLNIYSPSMLSDCIRKVYLIKSGEKRFPVKKIEAQSYFMNGNFMHLKWQFLMWKMHREGIITLIGQKDKKRDPLGAEIFVVNERGDYGGSIDNLCRIADLKGAWTIDWKSMNGSLFMQYVGGNPPSNYISQSVGYAGLAMEDRELDLSERIKSAIIIGENKNGPHKSRIAPSPLGLFEWRYPIKENKHLPADRLKRLRSYERREKVPPLTCKSTSQYLFITCPLSHYCRGEVEAVERRTRKAKRNPTPSIVEKRAP